MSDFSTGLEKQVREEIRKILADIHISTQQINGQWHVNIDVTEAENKLTKLALEMY